MGWRWLRGRARRRPVPGHGACCPSVMGRKISFAKVGCLATAAALTAGCALAPTDIESTWRDPTFMAEPFDRVAVVALFDSEAESRVFEESAARNLEMRGIEAVAGHTILEPDRMYEQAEMRALVGDADVDGILMFRLIAVDERRRYEPPTPYLRVPRGVIWGDPYYWYYYPHWNYYWHWRSSLDVVRSEGYWDTYTYVIVETSLYDAETDQLVWTAKSETLDGTRFDALAASVADKVTRRLVANDLLAASPTNERVG